MRTVALTAANAYNAGMLSWVTGTALRFMAIALAAGLALAGGAAEARGRGESAKPTPADSPRTEPSEALRKRIAEQRYFDVVQNSLRFTPPTPIIMAPRFR